MVVVVLLRRRRLRLHRHIGSAAGGARRGDSGQEIGYGGTVAAASEFNILIRRTRCSNAAPLQVCSNPAARRSESVATGSLRTTVGTRMILEIQERLTGSLEICIESLDVRLLFCVLICIIPIEPTRRASRPDAQP